MTRGSSTAFDWGVFFSRRFAVGADHAVDELGFGTRAAVGESCVGGGNIYRRHFVRAKSHGWGWLNVVAETHLTGDLHYAAVADQLGDLDGGDVERIGKGFTDGDTSHEFFAEIVRGVFLAVEFEGGGLVVDGGGGGDDRLDVIDGIVEGGRVDERLEDGARLPMS